MGPSQYAPEPLQVVTFLDSGSETYSTSFLPLSITSRIQVIRNYLKSLNVEENIYIRIT